MMWAVFPCLEIEYILPISGVFKVPRYGKDIKIPTQLGVRSDPLPENASVEASIPNRSI